MVVVLTNMSSVTIMNSKMETTSSLLSVNRSKLMKLAEGIKTKRKPNHKKSALNFKKDPSYSSNIEHLVFGTYRQRGSPANPALIPSSTTNGSPVNGFNDVISSSLEEPPPLLDDEGVGPKSLDPSSLSYGLDSVENDRHFNESVSLPVNLNDHDVAALGYHQAPGESSRVPEFIMRDHSPLESDYSNAESDPTSPTGRIRTSRSRSSFGSSDDCVKSNVGMVNGIGRLDDINDAVQRSLSNDAVSSGCASPEVVSFVNDDDETRRTTPNMKILTTELDQPERVQTPTSSCCSASTRSKQPINKSSSSVRSSSSYGNKSCSYIVMSPNNFELDDGISSAATSPTVTKRAAATSKKQVNGDVTGNRKSNSSIRTRTDQPKNTNDANSRIYQRQSTRERSGISTSVNRNTAGSKLNSSFSYGGSVTNNQRPSSINSASIQTVRKVTVSAANPSRPTVSTKVKLTVTSDGTNVDDSSQDVTARGHGMPTNLLKAGSSRSSLSGSRNSSRNSLTNGVVKTANSNAPQSTTRLNVRTKGMPAALSNLQSQGKFSSSSSLASSCRKLGSTSSLGGSQISLHSTSSAGQSECGGIRKSFHSVNYQRSISTREVTGGRSGKPVSSTRSPNSVPRNSGRMSLRLPPTNTIGKPPVCPSKIARPSPPKDKNVSLTTSSGKEQNKSARNSRCRIPCYKYPKAVSEPPVNLSLATKCTSRDDNGQHSNSVNVESSTQKQGPFLSNEHSEEEVPFEVSSVTLDECCNSNKSVEDTKSEPEPLGDVTVPPKASFRHSLLTQQQKVRPLPKSYSLYARLGPTETNQDLAQYLNGRKPPLPTRSVSVTMGDVTKLGLISQLGRRRSEFTVSQSDHTKSPLDSEEVDEVASEVVNGRSVCDDDVDTVLNTEDEEVGSLKKECVEDVVEGDTESVDNVKNETELLQKQKEREELEQRQDGDAEECSVPAYEDNDVDGKVVSCDEKQVVNMGENGSDSVLVVPSSGCCASSSRPYKVMGERTVPKCVRRIKATSSPVFVDSRVDAWVSEGDLRRPWSQICSEQDVERLVQAKSCALDPESISPGMNTIIRVHPATPVLSAVMSDCHSAHGNLFSRFSSMRNPNSKVPGGSVEGVLQKFRKSFSARFYKKVKDADSPTSVSKSCRHASFSSYLGDRSDSDVGNGTGDEVRNCNVGSGSLNHNQSSISDMSATDSSDGGETVFRLGPIVWRSSKERKDKASKKDRGKREVKDDGSTAISTPELNGLTTSCNSLNSQSEDTVNCKPMSGSSTPLPTIHARPNVYPACVTISPQLLRRRAKSTSLRFEKSKRPLFQEQGSLNGSILMDSRNGGSEIDGSGRHSTHLRNSVIGRRFASSTNEMTNFPPAVIVRRHRKSPTLRWSKGRSNLRRSVSQPLEMEKLDGMGSINQAPGGLSDQEDLINDLSAASSDEEICSDLENGDSNGNGSHRSCRHRLEYSEPIVYAEALWDHVTMDAEELAFKAGDLIEVLDDTDSEWWWGVVGNRAGWFPAPFVRARVNQEDTVEDCVAKMNDGTLRPQSNRKTTVSLLSNDQVRINVIMEIVSTEKDFVRHLKDVCEGYLKEVRKRTDMFPEDRVNTIFANIEQLYTFQSEFVSKLEQCINWEQPHLSQIGSCFTEHREGFEMYSEYCNNHPQSVSELQELYTNPKYAHFFEACRLLQDMIDISLDGFLLTPVQKICKYPLQLGELLKYTKTDHPDHPHVAEALETMRSVAQYINERKRRMECLEKLAAWQTTLEYWEGPNLLDHSSELIHSADVSKVTAAWSRDFTFFLFDHQIIICKKDLIKRNSYSYKSRIDMDTCEIVDIPDGKDPSTGLTLKNAWKMYCSRRNKWLVFATRTAEEKLRWMKAFDNERWRVEDDQRQGFVVTENAKKTAMMVVLNRKNPKRPKDKERKNVNRRNGRSDPYVISSKSGSLPSNLLLSTNKKKTTSGWFHFGSNKKTKR